uniref:Uncharacterized protein n=1 Tax=Rhizophagus irregularis (strain DAOM 181602 / DAOM 197198 / MUCL 43194) TaxID=747089 RepID=U9T0W7_RHIID
MTLLKLCKSAFIGKKHTSPFSHLSNFYEQEPIQGEPDDVFLSHMTGLHYDCELEFIA